MAIQIERVAPGENIAPFLDVAREIYRTDPNWVAPLDMEMTDRLNPKKNPFFEHAKAMYFVARKDGRLVGRATAQIDDGHQQLYGDKAGFFGFLDTIDDPAVARALLDACAEWLKDHGMVTMRGPMSLSINEEIGTLVEGFDTPPMIMMPHHFPYQGGLVEQAGLTKLKDVFAWTYDVTAPIPPRALRAHEALVNDPDVKIRTIDKSRIDEEVKLVAEIFNEAWSENWGFVPMTQGELKKTAEDFKLLLVEDLALIAEVKGKPAAMAISVPNLNEATRDLDGKLVPFGWAKLIWRLKVKGLKSARLILLGLRKEYRMQRKYAGLAIGLYTEQAMRGKKLGIETGELSWTLEDNSGINVGIRLMGGKVYKRYRVYERAL